MTDRPQTPSASEPPDTESRAKVDDRRFQVVGAEVVGGLFVLIKVALVHRMDNKAVEPVVERFHDALSRFQAEYGEEVAVQFVGDAVYINRRLVRADVNTWEKATFLRDFFGRIQMAELTFDEGVTVSVLRDFAQALRDVVMENRPRGELAKRGFKGIGIRGISAEAGAGENIMVVPDRLRVLRAYGLTVATLRDLLRRLESGRGAPLVPIRRSFQEFARLPDRTRPLQLGLLALEHHRAEPAGRMARVGILSVLLARRTGVRTGDLRDIGVAGALTGLGAALAGESLALDPDEMAANGELVEGVRRLLPYSGRGKGTVLRLVTATDQATPAGRRDGHPVSRLVAAAEAYDRLTMRAPFGPGLRPDEAIARVLGAPDIDRVAARLLVATIGLFPVGSTVRLSTGETAIVLDVTDDPQRLLEPRVLIIGDAQGRPATRRAVDLADSGISIEGNVDAAAMELNVGHFLFS